MSGRAVKHEVPPIGTQGNIWNAASTGTSVSTNFVQVYSGAVVSIFGHVSGACTITVYYSADGTNFYASSQTVVAAGAADISLDITTAAAFIALKSSANVTATVTVLAK